MNKVGGDNLIETIISMFANILSIFGVTVDVKKALSKLKYKKVRIICIAAFACVCCILIVCLYISTQKSIIVTKVMLSKETLIMKTNDTHTLIATVLCSDNSSNNTVLWNSSNNSVASIDSNGLITTFSEGTAIITAQASRNNSTEIAECVVTVQNPPSGYSIHAYPSDRKGFFYIYVEPYEDNITKVQIYGESPSGICFTPNIAEDNQYQFYYECGTWTIYASIENEAGTYNAEKPEDFITIEVTDISSDSFDDVLQNLIVP